MFLREIDRSSLRIKGAEPRSFGSAMHGAARHGEARQPHAWNRDISGAANYGGFARSGVASDAEKTSGWRRGQRLFHDDYGYGSVVEVRDSDEGPVVRVLFETGKELRFLSEHQGSAFVKINYDD